MVFQSDILTIILCFEFLKYAEDVNVVWRSGHTTQHLGILFTQVLIQEETQVPHQGGKGKPSSLSVES